MERSTIKPEIRERWIAALLSGDYQQGKNYLHYIEGGSDEAKWCCLGVLCDLAVKDGVINAPTTLNHPEPGESLETSSTYTVFRYSNSDGSSTEVSSVSLLPREVVEWAGLSSPHPCLNEAPPERAGWLNDRGVGFRDIAELIRALPDHVEVATQ